MTHNWTALSLGDKFVAVSAIFLIALIFYNISQNNAERELLIQQFHLPEDAYFKKLHVFRKSRLVTPPTIEAIVKFSEEDFRNYAARVRDTTLWQPIAAHYYKTVFTGTAAPDSIVWQEVSHAPKLVWGHVSSDSALRIREGKQLCYGWYEFADNLYRADTCAVVKNATAKKKLFMKALLDSQNRTLHLYMHGVGV